MRYNTYYESGTFSRGKTPKLAGQAVAPGTKGLCVTYYGAAGWGGCTMVRYMDDSSHMRLLAQLEYGHNQEKIVSLGGACRRAAL